MPTPKLIATDQLSWEQEFFDELLPLVSDILDVVTWHNYPLGPGYGNDNLDADIMTASYHDSFIATAATAAKTVKGVSEDMEVWMGETGGAYNTGHNETSDAFIDAF